MLLDNNIPDDMSSDVSGESSCELLDYVSDNLFGHTFNEIYKGINFYKFLHNDSNQYNIGLNVGTDTISHNEDTNDEFDDKGFYFCEEAKNHIFWNYYGTKVASVKIPDDAIVSIEDNRFKSNKIIIEEITNFTDIDDNFWINIVLNDYRALQHIKKQTNEIIELAIQQNGLALEYVINQTDEICSLAVKKNGRALQYVKNQTNEICILAIKQNGWALQYVETQTEEICSLAVKQTIYALDYVNDQQTKELCKLVV